MNQLPHSPNQTSGSPQTEIAALQPHYETVAGATVKSGVDFLIVRGAILEDELSVPADMIPKEPSATRTFDSFGMGNEVPKDVAMKVYAKWGEDLDRPVWLVGRADELHGRLFNYFPNGDQTHEFAPPEEKARFTQAFLTQARQKTPGRRQGREFSVDPVDASRYSVTSPLKGSTEQGFDKLETTRAASKRWMYSDKEWAERKRIPSVLVSSSLRKKAGALVAAAAFGLTGLGMVETGAQSALNYNGEREPVELGDAKISGEQDALQTANESINAWLTGGSEWMRARADYQEFRKDRNELHKKIDAAEDARRLRDIATQELGVGFLTIDSSIGVGRQKDMLKTFADAYRTLKPESSDDDQLDGLTFSVRCNISDDSVAGSYRSGSDGSEVICLGADADDVGATAFHELAHWVDDKTNHGMSDVMARISAEWGGYKDEDFDHNDHKMEGQDDEYFGRSYGMTNQREDLATVQEQFGDDNYIAGRDKLPEVRQDKFDEVLAMTEAAYPGYADRLAQTLEVQGDSSKPLLSTRDFIAMTVGLGGILVTARQSLLDRMRKSRGITR